MDDTFDDLRAKLVAAENHDYIYKLRDTFAAAALTGLLASGAFKMERFATTADYAFEYADLMLAARLKKE